ncbi:unnamed protein product [Fusarium fujikuroi]|uniref:Uncharacterized protein n=1 Tax=Fusarium fujikuroi TaxID=5127 RepID=A0A9Q9RVA4_FUSFU|nr:unnamed protein product [Fusarium fujikuroi]
MADENARTRNDTFDLGIWSFAIMARYGMNPPTMVDLFKDLLVQCRIAPWSSLLPGPRASRKGVNVGLDTYKWSGMGTGSWVSNRGEVRAVERKVEQRTVDVHGKAISTHLTSRNRSGLS